MKNASGILVFKQCSIIRLIKKLLCVIFLFDIGLLKVPAQTVSDVDGNVYNTVTLGTQVWITGNLKTTKYNDNLTIPLVTDPTAWALLSTPGYCWYNNDAGSYKATYGALYNWFAVNTGKLCPTGWHVPTYDQWTVLTDYLTNNGYGYGGSGSDIGKSMATKSGWTTYYLAGSVGNDPASNNSSGFTAFPGGFRYIDGVFQEIGNVSYFWTSTEYSLLNSFMEYLSYNSFYCNWARSENLNGYSVRCLKDLSTDITSSSTLIIEVYPNPVSGILNIDYKSENFETVSILNSQGVLMKKEKAITPGQQLDFSKYASGLYFLEFVKTSGEIKRVKVINH
jgi:uncharacterized protein (TIGR02145 family)